jgi:hypothetical protein
MGRTHDPLAMQKVVGSSPIIRFFRKAPLEPGVTRIYPPEMVHAFYDGACVPADALDGCALTYERLP